MELASRLLQRLIKIPGLDFNFLLNIEKTDSF